MLRKFGEFFIALAAVVGVFTLMSITKFGQWSLVNDNNAKQIVYREGLAIEKNTIGETNQTNPTNTVKHPGTTNSSKTTSTKRRRTTNGSKITAARSTTSKFSSTTSVFKTSTAKMARTTDKYLQATSALENSSVTVFMKGEPNVSQHYVCPGSVGGLGNCMFHYASNYGIALRNNLPVAIHKKEAVAKHFRLSAKIYNNQNICKNIQHHGEKKHCSYFPNFKNFSHTVDHKCTTYLQSWKYFKHVENSLRKQFTFRDEIVEKAVEIKDAAKNKSGITGSFTTVGVHIRKGLDEYSIYGYQNAPANYTASAMNYFISKFPNILFIVCSDNIKWSKENMPNLDKYHVAFIDGQTSPEVDMAILSSCDHVIMTVGTFGWWSAFLAGGITIYYKYPVREGSKLREQFGDDFSDYFFPGWIGME